ncbi:MAG: hypothetical protein KGI67_06295, partial [Pseudomonadota bacterium]|nr:hypothetical protein [Pseudomonadota bacterium]
MTAAALPASGQNGRRHATPAAAVACWLIAMLCLEVPAALAGSFALAALAIAFLLRPRSVAVQHGMSGALTGQARGSG